MPNRIYSLERLAVDGIWYWFFFAGLSPCYLPSTIEERNSYQPVIVPSFIMVSIAFGLMEFPWAVVGVVFSAVTLAVLLGYYIPRFVKATTEPRIDIDLFI